ncbi:acetate/propionate family kinase [Amaricoccus sp.]|uniref:acetate/propionate family kinase n=1 Tax=Amaricoccus sp. TaxID=1872485 RepID=UPI001B47A070|nr:acetate/propionate family kinase [Amaricoccus sp.]MBP7002154.1 acetate/propionate family kinase [Amaricoccus sp.]
MADAILVVNAGSSSLKFTEYYLRAGGALEVAVRGSIEELYGAARFRARDAAGGTLAEHAWEGEAPGHAGALDHLFGWLQGQAGGDDRLIGVGHRVVHGGADHAAPVRVDAGVLAALERLAPLAPLHQPHNLLPIRLIAERRGDLPQVACFDTAFHASAPALSQAFALPARITDLGVRRYGFHGLSYEYIASALPEHDPKAAAGRTVVLHLGNGASMCAVGAGRSVASTMGFTALDGLPMGTRSGALDPGVVLYLMQELGMDAAGIEALLYKESGLLGVSGVSSDMRALLESDAPSARLAVELFAYRIGRELGSLAAALGGLDAVVFTAGIGENSAAIRAMAAERAGWLGLRLDAEANAAGGPRISTADSAVAAWVIPTNEELMIARHTLNLVN